MVRVRGVVRAGTGLIGFPKRRSRGVLNYDGVHRVRRPLTDRSGVAQTTEGFGYTVYLVEKRVPEYE